MLLDFLVNRLSYLGFVVFLALCGVGLPIPEEAPLVLAGVLSSNGTLEHPLYAFAACLAGALLGDSVMYFIGRHFGHGFLMRHPTMARIIDAEREEKFEHVVRRHGFKVVLLTRFMVGVRGPVYFAAGAARVPYLKFLIWDFCAATLVVGAVFGLSYLYGDRITRWVSEAELLVTVLAAAVLIILGVVLYRSRKRRTDIAIEKMEQEELTEPEAGATPAVGLNGAAGDATRHPEPDPASRTGS